MIASNSWLSLWSTGIVGMRHLTWLQNRIYDLSLQICFTTSQINTHPNTCATHENIWTHTQKKLTQKRRGHPDSLSSSFHYNYCATICRLLSLPSSWTENEQSFNTAKYSVFRFYQQNLSHKSLDFKIFKKIDSPSHSPYYSILFID